MVNREKVIEGLHTCFTKADCNGCPYEEECRYVMLGKKQKGDEWHCPILDDVMELLNDQVARVMTVDEVLNWANLNMDDTYPIYVEFTTGGSWWYVYENDAVRFAAQNGKCRCWTKKPTYKQMRDTPWIP